MRRFLACWMGVIAWALSSFAMASPSGLINMPDARFNPDGTLRFGMAYARPYFDVSANATLLPWLETNLAVTRISGVPGFFTPTSTGFGAAYGAYKDRNTGIKIRLISEEGWWPSVAVGAQDPFGTSLFPRQFAAATKTLGDAQFTLGYGRQQIDGAFGGLRYSPSWAGNWSLVSEYDASDYKNFPFAEETHVGGRRHGMSSAIDLRLGWTTTAISNQRGVAGAAAYISIPLEQKEWIPKSAEPEPYAKVIPRPTLAQWERDASYRTRMYAALFRQDFKDVRIRMEPNARLSLTLTNSRISQMSRAVGRAARTALLLAPLETTEIRVTYTTSGLPVATYEFTDLRKLNRYFNGLLTRSELAESVSIRYADPSSYSEKEKADLMAALEEPTQARVLYGSEGNYIGFKSQDAGFNVFQVRPTLSSYLNGPNVFQYSLGVLTTYDRELAERLFLSTGVNTILYENISQALRVNNSTLPHVRSDFGEYAKGPRVRVDHVLLNRVYQPSERTYARLSGGWLEQMYGGVGGQWLYVERGTPWAFDVSIDAVKQRDFDGRFDFRDYQTVTALAAGHYKLPYQSTLTTRVGRLLAPDYGARFEIKRRFRIGMELGAWYTVTNAVDTGVGDEKNYRDKGVFVSIPFEALLPSDSRVVTGFSIAPWTRDIGQMVNSPVDLYQMLEKPLMLDMHKSDGLARLGDVEDDYNLPYLGSPMWDRPFENLGRMTVQDWGHGAGALGNSGAWQDALIGTGAGLGSAALDRSVARVVDRHAGSGAIGTADSVGKSLPLAAMFRAGLAALSQQDKRLSNTGIAAVQGRGPGLPSQLGIKHLGGRAPPVGGYRSRGLGPVQRSQSYLPSDHPELPVA